MLRNAAYKRALIALGYSQEANAIQLTTMEKIAAWFAGNLPEECVPSVQWITKSENTRFQLRNVLRKAR